MGPSASAVSTGVAVRRRSTGSVAPSRIVGMRGARHGADSEPSRPRIAARRSSGLDGVAVDDMAGAGEADEAGEPASRAIVAVVSGTAAGAAIEACAPAGVATGGAADTALAIPPVTSSWPEPGTGAADRVAGVDAGSERAAAGVDGPPAEASAAALAGRPGYSTLPRRPRGVGGGVEAGALPDAAGRAASPGEAGASTWRRTSSTRLGRADGVPGAAGDAEDAAAGDAVRWTEGLSRCGCPPLRGGILRETATPGGVDEDGDGDEARPGVEERAGAPAPIGSIEAGGGAVCRARVVLASGCEGAPALRAATLAPGGGATEVATAPGPASGRAPTSGRSVESGAITRGKRGRRKR
ncbi:MAG: hypothetical protein AMXMBFR23_10790 [Chloroflexota bacterium]